MNTMEITCKECRSWYTLFLDDNEPIDDSCPVCKSDDVKIEWVCSCRSCDDD